MLGGCYINKERALTHKWVCTMQVGLKDWYSDIQTCQHRVKYVNAIRIFNTVMQEHILIRFGILSFPRISPEGLGIHPHPVTEGKSYVVRQINFLAFRPMILIFFLQVKIFFTKIGGRGRKVKHPLHFDTSSLMFAIFIYWITVKPLNVKIS